MPVLGVELVRLRSLPYARALEGGLIVVGPGELELNDDLAGLLALVLAGALL
jgi:hypothetical protein